jgi:hypothetical protein
LVAALAVAFACSNLGNAHPLLIVQEVSVITPNLPCAGGPGSLNPSSLK